MRIPYPVSLDLLLSGNVRGRYGKVSEQEVISFYGGTGQINHNKNNF